MNFDDILSGVTPNNLQALACGLQVTGQLYSAYEKAQYAKKVTDAAAFVAGQLDQNAGQARAAAQLDAAEAERQGRLAQSRALAVAAGSGAGASDPTVLNIISRNAAEIAYRRSAALYQGEARALGMEHQADATIKHGDIDSGKAKAEATAYGLAAGSNLMTSLAKNSSMYERFGGGGPKQAPSDAPKSSSILGWLTD